MNRQYKSFVDIVDYIVYHRISTIRITGFEDLAVDLNTPVDENLWIYI